MNKPSIRTTRKLIETIGLALLLLVAAASRAADGFWNVDADGNWSVSANWLGSVIAGGAGSTGYFTNEVTATRTD